MSVPGVFVRVAELQQMVAELGAGVQAPPSAGGFARALAAQGNPQEAPTAGTGPFPPSPAPSSPALPLVAVTAESIAALGGLPPLDTTSFGDDGAVQAAGLAAPAAFPAPAATGPVAPAGALSARGAQLSAAAGAAVAAVPAGAAAGQRLLAAAQSALGITESPAGANDGPGLELFRSAVAGAQPGQPWCAYFTSWAARQAGVPLGDGGRGEGAVEGIAEWASRSGRLLGSGSRPAPGDLVLFGGRHVGVVEAVNPDGTLTTVEGNYRNSVQRVRRSPLEATGYVRLG